MAAINEIFLSSLSFSCSKFFSNFLCERCFCKTIGVCNSKNEASERISFTDGNQTKVMPVLYPLKMFGYLILTIIK